MFFEICFCLSKTNLNNGESELGRLFDDSKLNHCKRYKYDKR